MANFIANILPNHTLELFTLIVSVFTFCLVQPLRHSQNELQMREILSNAKNKVLETTYNLIKEEADTSWWKRIFKSHKNKIGGIKKIAEAAIEDYRNMYDELCAKYLEGKLDRKHFRKMYKSEIKKRYEEDKEYYERHQEQYEATCKVYKKWFGTKSLKEKFIDFMQDFGFKLLGLILIFIAILLISKDLTMAISIVIFIVAIILFRL